VNTRAKQLVLRNLRGKTARAAARYSLTARSTFLLLARVRKGEEDTISVCEVLRERLNGDGAHWGSMVLGREPADRILVDSNDPNVTLEVQVVRCHRITNSVAGT
jgi:hypothetical protein